MAVRGSTVVTTAVLAGLGDVALLAINRPGVFTGSGSSWSIVATAIANYVAVLIAIIFSLRGTAPWADPPSGADARTRDPLSRSRAGMYPHSGAESPPADRARSRP